MRQRYNVTFDGSNRTRLGQAVIDPMNHQTLGESDPFGRLWASKQFSGLYSGGPLGRRRPTPSALLLQRAGPVDLGDRSGQQQRLISYDGLGRKSGMSIPTWEAGATGMTWWAT
ncbi:MAG: hypothetical protein M9927_00650 [Anaerolineae bacterium]|nr:hypothetical protein [Anaerolineae bacterium]